MRMAKKYRTWSRRIERNILACYLQANDQDRAEGMEWYLHAHEIARLYAQRYNLQTHQTAGVIAAISPGLTWGLNVLQAETLIQEWSKGNKIPTLGAYGRRNVNKAIAILNGREPLAVLGGFKVRAFYALIANPFEPNPDVHPVVVDRHAKCLALNKPSAGRGASSELDAEVTKAQYRYLAWHYEKLAERLGLLPHQLQAITWLTWRRVQGRLEQMEIPFA